MKLNNRTILQSVAHLSTLSKIKLPIKGAFSISLALRKLQEIKGPLDIALKELYRKHAIKDDSGEVRIEDGKFTVKNYAEFIADYNELMNMELEVPGIRQIPLIELSGISVEPETLTSLHWLLTE